MFYLAIAQILEKAKRVQKIAPQHSRTSPVPSVGSLTNVRDVATESVVSIYSGSRRVTQSVSTIRAPRGAGKLVRRLTIQSGPF